MTSTIGKVTLDEYVELDLSGWRSTIIAHEIVAVFLLQEGENSVSL